jgi:CBS domain-containing protein
MHTVNSLLNDKSAQLFFVTPQDSVFHAIELMANQHVGALLVMENGVLLGIISERDYARKVILLNRGSRETKVGDIMSSPAIVVKPEDTVHHCMQIMTVQRIRHLPVIRDARVVGILSIGDLVKAVMEDQSRKIEELERYIAG